MKQKQEKLSKKWRKKMDVNKLIPGLTELFTEWREASKDKQITVEEFFTMLDTVKETALDVLNIREKVLIKL
jgi:NTP pyrophosphatase (non-canonical NTP hydrolase)